MTESEIFKDTKGAYIALMRPNLTDDEYRQYIESVIVLAPSAPDELVASMIAGSSWRERLLGLCMAMAKEKQPAMFIESMFQSLRDPRGLSTVPTCAALAVLARRGVFAMPQSFGEMFDPTPFNGEVGWAVKKAMCFVGLCNEDFSGDGGSNDGQSFESHVRFYESLRKS